MTDTNTSAFLRKKDAACLLSCSIRSLDRMIEDHSIPTYHLSSRHILLKRSDLEDLLEASIDCQSIESDASQSNEGDAA